MNKDNRISVGEIFTKDGYRYIVDKSTSSRITAMMVRVVSVEVYYDYHHNTLSRMKLVSGLLETSPN